MSSSETILVTGATGFIGSALTRQLVNADADVRIFRRETSSLELLEGVADCLDHAVGDLTNPRSLYDAMQGVDRVYHVGAKVSFDARDREVLWRVNADGTAHVVDAALEADIDRLVHTSSADTLGPPAEPEGVINETTRWQNESQRSSYACSKRRAELEVHRGIEKGLDAVIVNPTLVFGVGCSRTNTRRIIDAVRTGWVLAAPAGFKNVVDVRDVVEGLRAAMARGETGRRYLLGGENLSWQAMGETLAEAFGVTPPRYEVPPAFFSAGAVVAEAVATLTCTRPVLTRSMIRAATRTYHYDNSRARRELGCTFRSFDKTARWIARTLSTGSGSA